MSKWSPQGRAAVVGAGTMGAQIAAHLANAGWTTTLLDIVPPTGGVSAKERNAFAQRGIDRSLKTRPAAFFLADYASRIRVGNVEDDLAALQSADWIVEAVLEKPDIKQATLAKIEAHARPDALIATNTSGLAIGEMAAGCSPEFKKRFFGAHFFNPPRYMKLLELIPTADTDRELLASFAQFAEIGLGKRTVLAKDTPGFIANRIGVWAMLRTLHAALEHGLSVDEVDALTGPLVGHPKSATLRLSDICGLDITADVASNLRDRLPKDRWYPYLDLPGPVNKLLEMGRIGEKCGAGFYQRGANKVIQSIDWETLEYGPRKTATFPEIEGLKSLPLGERLNKLFQLTTPAGKFLWETTRDLLCYVADIAYTIADDIVAIDQACKWGFNWELGPFETLDALGVKAFAGRVAADGIEVPAFIQRVADSAGSFYSEQGGTTTVVCLGSQGGFAAAPNPPEYLSLPKMKASGGVIKDTADATLLDMGDGVYCVEFHTKMNVLGPGVLDLLDWSRAEAERNARALVIGNQGDHFSAGFNLQLVLMGIYEGDFDEMLRSGGHLQDVGIRLKRAKVPVVAAVHGYTLGGGCEIMLCCHDVVAAAESYIGLPEVGVGLIPAGGGTTQMLLRAMKQVAPNTDPFPHLREAFLTMGMAKVGSCADEARNLGFLRSADGVAMNRDRILHDAKQRAIALSEIGHRPIGQEKVMVLGEDGLARFEVELHYMARAGFISEHDRLIGHELAWVMCGGNLPHPQEVTEEYLHRLEKEAFVRLCGTPKTAERIKHMLETGKPLRN